MNKIRNLLDKKFVIDLFIKEVLPKYPDFLSIKQIKIFAIKEHIWETTYHVVFKFETTFITIDKKEKTFFIYCGAHSNEPRLNSYEASEFLWKNHFSQKNLTIPKPLFYSDYFNAFFYEGVIGENFYQYIRAKDLAKIEEIIPKISAWFAKLHQLSTQNVGNFNIINSKIETIIPGKIHFLDKVSALYPCYYEACQKIYEIIDNQEKDFFSRVEEKWFIHGDAHPENIICTKQENIAVVDFADFCLADFARDLGSFLQQLDFMMSRKINDQLYVKKIQKLFLKTYFDITKKTLDSDLQNRIDNYYNWTALRTVIFFLSKEFPSPERAHGLLIKICQNLKLNINI